MKMYRISYTTTCPLCNTTEHINMRGMGESHAEWITNCAKRGEMPGFTCKHCGQDQITATLRGVQAEQEGKK